MTNSTMRVASDRAELDVTIGATVGDTLHLTYRLRNTGGVALAVFDRGDRQAVLAGRLVAGDVGEPTVELVGEDVVLRHVGRGAPPGRFTGPTVPATPLALELVPGATLEGGFRFTMTTSRPPVRVRWCLGIAPLGGDGFTSPQRVGAGTLWQAGDEALALQQTLCTPWWDMAAGRIATEQGRH